MNLLEKIAEGKEREVYRHPGDPNKIVKIMKPGHDTARWDRNAGEFAYYKLLNAEQKSRLATIYGLVETNRGRGSIAEFVQDYDGRPSRQLHTCVEENILDIGAAEEMLAEFFAWADRCAVALVTANIDNFLCQFDREGRRRLVMIDGFGPASMNLKWRIRLALPALTRLRTSKTRQRVMSNWQRWSSDRGNGAASHTKG